VEFVAVTLLAVTFAAIALRCAESVGFAQTAFAEAPTAKPAVVPANKARIERSDVRDPASGALQTTTAATYALSTVRPLGRALWMRAEVGSNLERTGGSRPTTLQATERIAVGWRGPDRDVALSWRSVSGTGGLELPGFALTYARRYAGGAELVASAGTLSTLSSTRWSLTYRFALGGG
jgi:hypothetical protein